ncbi:MAG: DUF454 domain-containing protein [Candidatus Aminicenantes bacterium]|nr:DUF454 domain-containing protein [Candidatus Aminicenantes bacterium]
MKSLKSAFLAGAGVLFVALGLLGIVLPVLPTTPFLLLAAWCFARSSKRFYVWLTTNRLFGRYLRDYREGRGIPARKRALAVVLLWLTIGSTILFAVSSRWARAALLAVAAGVTVHLARMKTYRPEPRAPGRRPGRRI